MGIRNLLALAGMGALTVAVAILTGTTAPPGTQRAIPVAQAAPAATSTVAADGSQQPTTDDRGYLNSAARCPAGQTAVAAGRTRRSQVVICANGSDEYTYRGVRTSDNAELQLDASPSADGFVAHTDGASYAVSPTELVVVSGGKVIYRDTWIEYTQPTGPAAG